MISSQQITARVVAHFLPIRCCFGMKIIVSIGLANSATCRFLKKMGNVCPVTILDRDVKHFTTLQDAIAFSDLFLM